MALELSLSSAESNDNTTFTVTDDAGAYDAVTNLTGWGAPNLTVATITTLTLDIDITDAGGTTTTYDQIDLATDFGPLADRGDLVFAITSDLLLVSGVALGLVTDELPDGLYDLIYTVDEGLGTEDIHTETALVYGVVKVLVYEKLRVLPNQYLSKDCITREIQETTLSGTYLTALESTSSDQTIIAAKSEEILGMLGTLNSIVVNGSTIVW